MPYVKANALTVGTNAEAEKLAENYEDARRYINRDIVTADLADDSVDFPEIVRGEYSDITGLHQFTFGFGWGLFLDRQLRNVNPISNKSKNESIGSIRNQSALGTSADTSHIVTMWQTVPDSGIQIELERAALVTYRAWTEVVIAENLCKATAPTMNVIPQHRYTTFTALRDPTVAAGDDPVPLNDSTLGRHYDETEFATSGSPANSSWAGPIGQDPYRDTTSSDGYKQNIYPYYYRRMYCITKTWELSAGLHNFGLLVDAHHHNGVFWTTNCTVEVEYI